MVTPHAADESLRVPGSTNAMIAPGARRAPRFATVPLCHSATSPRARRSRPAFALLDVIIAGIIIGISLAAIIGLTGRALSAQARGEELQIAAMLADEQLNLVLARGPDNYTRSFAASGECDPPFSNYTYSVEVAGGSSSAPHKVTVTISWAGGTRSVALQTLIAAREGDDPDPDRKPPETTTRP